MAKISRNINLGIIMSIVVFFNTYSIAATTEYNASPIISIQKWAKCDGISDDLDNLTKAINLAKNNSFTLEIDCPLKIKIGMDIAKPIFIESDTQIIFSKKGSIQVDNVFVPAFVIANSSNIILKNWKIIYSGGLPIDDKTNEYINNGKVITSSGHAPPANAFNNVTLSNWLMNKKNIKFNPDTHSFWSGTIDPAAIFYIKGDSANLTFQNTNLEVQINVSMDKFIPVAFALIPDYVSNQIVTTTTPIAKPYVEVPHDIIFDGISLDGYYFGWHGSTQHTTFKNINAYRYSVLQDINKNNIGGIGKWFPPPHLFYLNYQNYWDNSLYNKYLILTTIIDNGIREGGVEDQLGDQHIAGNANSLKIQANKSQINRYTSLRPDGFADVMSSQDLSFTHINATYDSSFINYLFPILRFPCKGELYTGYQNVTFNDMILKDLAASTTQPPISGNYDERNQGIHFNATIIS